MMTTTTTTTVQITIYHKEKALLPTQTGWTRTTCDSVYTSVFQVVLWGIPFSAKCK
jgi:hypothetical protein